MKYIVTAVSFATLLVACSTAQVQGTASAVQTACNDALTAANTAEAQLKGGALNTAHAVAAYVTAACGTADAVAAVAQNPSSAEWLGTLTGELTTLSSSASGS
jgi:hypothetical protein